MPNTQTSLPVLQWGSRNNNVKAFQILLNQWRVAHERRKITVDGGFGRETLLSVFDFQRSEHLVADGKVGQDTLDKLTALLAAGLPLPPADEWKQCRVSRL